MLKTLHNLFHRSAPRARALDAAGGGRRWAGDPGGGSFAADLMVGGPVVRRRAAYFHRNNPFAARASAILVSNLIGTGIKPQSEHPDVLVRDAIDDAFARWAADADASGALDFAGVQALAVRSVVETGEVFAVLRIAADELRVQLIDPAQVDPTLHREINATTRIISGIEVDDAGQRLAYYIFPTPPGDPFGRPTQASRIESLWKLEAFSSSNRSDAPHRRRASKDTGWCMLLSGWLPARHAGCPG